MLSTLAPFYMEDDLEAGRLTARFNALESGGPPLSLGEVLDCVAPDESRRECLEALASISLRDSPNRGRDDLRDHIARLHPGAQRHNVLVTTGTSEALLLLLLVLRPRRVAVIAPGFQLLTELVTGVGATLVPLTLSWGHDGTPRPDIQRWANEIIRHRPDLLLINHPHNPSGIVLSADELNTLQDAAHAVRGAVLGDEHYRFLTDKAPLGDTLWPDQQATQTDLPPSYITGSFIKCLGTPGLRIGWCLAPPETVAAMQNLKNYTTHTVNPLSEWIAERVLRNTTLNAFEAARAIWRHNRQALGQWLTGDGRQSGWLGTSPAGGWVTCLTHQGLPAGSAQLRTALERAGCGLLDLKHFEWRRFGHKDCAMTARGGYRLGLGMAPQQFLLCLEELGRAGAAL